MKTVLVTGATGCIGSNLIARLVERGCNVRAFHRNNSNLSVIEHLDLDHRIGDIRDPAVVLSAVQGCDTVFHTAAIVSFWRRMRNEQLDVNINGTKTVVEACIRSGVKKLVHTSSIAALGYRRDGELIDETTPFNWNERITYRLSKHRSELEVLKGVADGLDATIVNPSVVIGPNDAHLHGGAIVRSVARGNVPAYVEGGMNLVSVHDVVRGHIAAAERGRSGERYILGGVNLTHRDAFNLIAGVLHAKKPRVKAPVWSVKALARACEIVGELTNSEPWISRDLISGLGMNNWYTSQKAVRELSYSASPLGPVILNTYEWFKERGLL